jgi:hypothetical protein
MDQREGPVTEPRGALVPPPRRPPTAVDTMAPLPPRPRPPAPRRRSLIEVALDVLLDRLDVAADFVAHTIGVRRTT